MLLRWKSFFENVDTELTVSQQNDLEDYLYTYCGFDKQNLNAQDIEKLKREYNPKSEKFSNFLEQLDKDLDWFDYRKTPFIIDFINDIIKDYYGEGESNSDSDFSEYEIGDFVYFGKKWGAVYVLAFEEEGILVSRSPNANKSFLIPDDEIEETEIIKKK